MTNNQTNIVRRYCRIPVPTGLSILSRWILVLLAERSRPITLPPEYESGQTEKFVAWPSLEKLVFESESNKRSVQRSLSELEQKGYLRRFHYYEMSHPEKAGKGDLYVISDNPDPDFIQASEAKETLLKGAKSGTLDSDKNEGKGATFDIDGVPLSTQMGCQIWHPEVLIESLMKVTRKETHRAHARARVRERISNRGQFWIRNDMMPFVKSGPLLSPKILRRAFITEK